MSAPLPKKVKGKGEQGARKLDWKTCFSCVQWLRREAKGQLKPLLPNSVPVIVLHGCPIRQVDPDSQGIERQMDSRRNPLNMRDSSPV
jgi:hypothetical protein